MDSKKKLKSFGITATPCALMNCLKHGIPLSKNIRLLNKPAFRSLDLCATRLTGTTLKIYS